MENFWDPQGSRCSARGPIQLQTHGGEIRWRNVFIREIPADEANRILSEHDDAAFAAVFNGKDFTGWAGPLDNYEIVDGAIRCKPKKGGTIYTKKEYADFVARLEFKLPPGGNNGLAIRYPGEGDTAYVGMCELQVLDDTAPEVREARPAPVPRLRLRHGRREARLPASGRRVELRGGDRQRVTDHGRAERHAILDADLSKVTEFMDNKPHPGKDRTAGHFGFAGHNDPVEYRRVRIKELY